MDIKQLQTFLVVARLLNFRAAAEELHYSQSTVFFIHTHMLYHANKWMSPPLAALKDLIKSALI